MTTEEFLKAYTDNLMQALTDGKISLSYIAIECSYCPLRDQCEKDCELHLDKVQTCADFFQEKLSDAKAFKRF